MAICTPTPAHTVHLAKRTGADSAYQRAVQRYLQKHSKKLAEKYIHKAVTKEGQAELKAQSVAQPKMSISDANGDCGSQSAARADESFPNLLEHQVPENCYDPFLPGEDDRLFYGPVGHSLGLLASASVPAMMGRWPGQPGSTDADSDDGEERVGDLTRRRPLTKSVSDGNLVTDYLWKGMHGVGRAASQPSSYDRLASGYLRRICSSDSLCRAQSQTN